MTENPWKKEKPYDLVHNEWNEGYNQAIEDAIDVTGFTATLEALRKKVEE